MFSVICKMEYWSNRIGFKNIYIYSSFLSSVALIFIFSLLSSPWTLSLSLSIFSLHCLLTLLAECAYQLAHVSCFYLLRPTIFNWEKVEGELPPLAKAEGALLSFSMLNKSDNGMYICHAGNDIGKGSGSYTLDVQGKRREEETGLIGIFYVSSSYVYFYFFCCLLWQCLFVHLFPLLIFFFVLFCCFSHPTVQSLPPNRFCTLLRLFSLAVDVMWLFYMLVCSLLLFFFILRFACLSIFAL